MGVGRTVSREAEVQQENSPGISGSTELYDSITCKFDSVESETEGEELMMLQQLAPLASR